MSRCLTPYLYVAVKAGKIWRVQQIKTGAIIAECAREETARAAVSALNACAVLNPISAGEK